jgi:hypothetical protein
MSGPGAMAAAAADAAPRASQLLVDAAAAGRAHVRRTHRD